MVFTTLPSKESLFPDAHLLPWERKALAQYRYEQSNQLVVSTFEIGTFELSKEGKLLRFIAPTTPMEEGNE